MSSLDDALSTLLTERDAAQQRLQDLDAAIRALRRLLPPSADESIAGHRLVDRADSAERDSIDGASGTKDLILRLFRAPGDVLRVDDVYNELLAAGWRTSSDRPRHMVASNLSKLATAGQLLKAGYGTYQRPPLFDLGSGLSDSENEGAETSAPTPAGADEKHVFGPHGN